MNVRTWLRAEWDRVAGYALVLIGGLLVLLGYVGVKNTPFTNEALSYIASGGVGGLFCLGLGVGLLISADLHDEWRKLDRIEAALRGNPLPDSGSLLDLTLGRATTRDEAVGSSEESEPTHLQSGQRVAHHATTSGGEAEHAMRVGGTPTLALAPDWRASGLSRTMILGSLALLIPASLMGGGWRSAARTVEIDTAARGLGVAVLGLALSLAVIGICVVSLRSGVARRASRLLRPLLPVAASTMNRPPEVTAASGANGTGSVDSQVLVVAGLHRFHRPGCPTLSGLDPRQVGRSELDPDVSPCGLCGAR